MLFFVTGASGSGKTSALPGLKAAAGEIKWHDFDELGVPAAPCPDEWRPRMTEQWLSVAVANQRSGIDTGVVGGAVPGEILACPSAPKIDGIHILLLDCHDVTRIDRLKRRGGSEASQSVLNWAAWLRMHATDPEWRSDVICTPKTWDQMRWEAWANWKRGDVRWKVDVIDTTYLSIEEVVSSVIDWMIEVRALYWFCPRGEESASAL